MPTIWDMPRVWGVVVEATDTGGGFKAYRAELSGGGYALITACHDETKLPQQTDKFVDVGFYNASGEQVCSCTQVSTAALLGLIVGFRIRS